MYKGIKQVVASEQEAAKQQEEKLARSQRRSRFLFSLVAFAVPVILVLLAGNAGMVYMVGRLTRETQVNKGGEMVAMDATPIQTAKASYAGDIFDIARTAAIDMESDEAVGFLQGIKSVTYGDPLSSDPNAAVVAEVTAKAVAAGTMKFDLANGATVLVDAAKGVASLSSASVGVISFDTAGTPKMATTYAMEGDAAKAAERGPQGLPGRWMRQRRLRGRACILPHAREEGHVPFGRHLAVAVARTPDRSPSAGRAQASAVEPMEGHEEGICRAQQEAHGQLELKTY